eukprot:s10774_g2.t1
MAGFPEDLTLEESPKGDSHGQSNGTAENAVQRVQGQVRTMKYALEQSAGGELPKDSVIFPWMIEYAGVLHTLFSQEDSEGMTPFQKLKGRTWQIALPSPNADADRLPEPIAIEPVVAPTELPPQPGQTERLPQRETEYFTKIHEAEEKKRKAATEKEGRSEPGGAEASEPSQTVEKRKPSKAEPASAARESKKPAVTVSEAASASIAFSLLQGDQERSEPRPAEDRAEASKRKAADTEGMIETLITGERKAWVESLEGVEQPTCDLVDGLAEEILAVWKMLLEWPKELPAEGVKAARAEEVSVIKQMGVWEVIPRPSNENVIGTRWIDINKGDGARLKLRSRLGQAVIALSTGEAEYYGLISTASTALGEQTMMADWGVKLSVNIAMDASARISIGSRRGLGKVKHIDTCYLWVQEIVDEGRMDGLLRQVWEAEAGLGKGVRNTPKDSQGKQSVIPTREA